MEQPSYRTRYYSPTNGERAAHPELWHGCIGAWCPSLGPTGLTLIDHSGLSNHGTFSGIPATNWEASSGKYAVKGVSSGANTSEAIQIDGTKYTASASVTFSLWLKRPNADAGAWYLTSVNANNHFMFGNVIYDATFSDTRYTITPNYTGFDWTHYCVVRTATSWKAYQNGRQIHSTTPGAYSFASTMLLLNSDRAIGGYYTYGGYQDDARLYSRALSEREVFKLYNVGRGGAYQVASPRRYFVAAVVGGLSIPVAFNHYQKLRRA